jgi:hypothetical protein
MPDELHIKECEKLGISLTEDFDIVEQALNRLEFIDNANPSEAFETVYNNIDYLISDIVIENDEVNGCLMTIKEQLPTIKNALLKTQAPKQYLQWEDLKFTYDEQKIKVKLNGENYTVVYFISPAYYGHNEYEYVGILKDDDIVVYSINGYLYTANLLKQFFNNLHLEVIE